MENIVNYIKPELLVLIPVLFFCGMALKRAKSVADNHIPLILGAAGVALAVMYVLAISDITSWQDVLSSAFAAVTQGVLCAGCSVYVNQVGKQTMKKGRENIVHYEDEGD